MTQQHLLRSHYNWVELDPKIVKRRRKGFTLKQIAEKLNINYNGLMTHLYNSRAKSGGGTACE